MSFMGIGPLEFLAILVIAFIVLGPTRMVSSARQAGKMARQLRKMTEGLPKSLEDLEKLGEPSQDKQKTTSLRADEPSADATPWQPGNPEPPEPKKPAGGS